MFVDELETGYYGIMVGVTRNMILYKLEGALEGDGRVDQFNVEHD